MYLICFLIISHCISVYSEIQYYELTESYSGPTFFDQWTFITYDDPTNGTVDYSTQSSNLAYITSSSTSIIKVDNESLALDGRGRKSIRIESKNQYNEGLFAFDTKHIPYGCGTWPAFWLFGPSWPINGEIDVLEQIHKYNYTKNVLHTTDQCDFTNYNTSNLFSGHWEKGKDGVTPAKSCNKTAPNQWINQGCGIAAHDGTFGSKWNSNNGGVTILLIDRTDGIRIWMFDRNHVPSIISNNSDTISTQHINHEFGFPISYFPFGSHCPASSFNDLNIVINIALCGDFAGNSDVWSLNCASDTNYSTCDEFVRKEPGEFGHAYWEINYLKIFQIPSTNSPTSITKSPTNIANLPTRSTLKTSNNNLPTKNVSTQSARPCLIAIVLSIFCTIHVQ